MTTTTGDDAVAFTVYYTCTGDPVLAIEADPELAEGVARRLGHRLWDRCGQCGDTSYVEITYTAEEVTGAPLEECTVITAAELDDLVAANTATPAT